MENNKPLFFTITEDMAKDKNLSKTKTLLVGLIKGIGDKKGMCCAKNGYFATHLENRGDIF